MAIGTPVQIDENTFLVLKGRFAGIYVKLDLIKPLVAQIWIGEEKYHMGYKGLHIICFYCGCIGHSMD